MRFLSYFKGFWPVTEPKTAAVEIAARMFAILLLITGAWGATIAIELICAVIFCSLLHKFPSVAAFKLADEPAPLIRP